MSIKHNKVELRETEEPQNDHDRNNVMLQVKEVAELLGIHPNTVRIWTDSGVLRAYRIGPRKDRRIPLEAVKFMLDSR